MIRLQPNHNSQAKTLLSVQKSYRSQVANTKPRQRAKRESMYQNLCPTGSGSLEGDITLKRGLLTSRKDGDYKIPGRG
jgi:hypothetical protein